MLWDNCAGLFDGEAGESQFEQVWHGHSVAAFGQPDHDPGGLHLGGQLPQIAKGTEYLRSGQFGPGRDVIHEVAGDGKSEFGVRGDMIRHLPHHLV